MNYEAAANEAHLEILGLVHENTGTVLLLGPHEPGFWSNFSASSEYLDGEADPMDRWSHRIIGVLATQWGGTAVFPSDGPPYPPFIGWAQASGRAWASPVGMLLQDRAGLMVSFRGAIRIPRNVLPNVKPDNPCDSCVGKPCLTACPVAALGEHGYDVPACHAWLDTSKGETCMTGGCLVRRACPVSQSYGRLAEQSAFHMRSFHKG